MNENRTHYGHPYFEAVGTKSGINRLRHNTCRIIDFNLLVLAPGERYAFSTDNREFGLAILTGTVDVTVNKKLFPGIGGRDSVFTAPPSGVYAGCGSEVVIEAKTPLQIALTSAPSSTSIDPYAIAPETSKMGQWGGDNTTRHFRYLIDNERPSERLWLAEVVVRDGRWATYPPHKHEDVPEDLFQEEMYFYKVEPAHGFGFCALFEGQTGGDYAFMIRDNTIHKMPCGYHTVTAAPGYQIYYLALYAGMDKRHKPSMHPDHAHYGDNVMPVPLI